MTVGVSLWLQLCLYLSVVTTVAVSVSVSASVPVVAAVSRRGSGRHEAAISRPCGRSAELFTGPGGVPAAEMEGIQRQQWRYNCAEIYEGNRTKHPIQHTPTKKWEGKEEGYKESFSYVTFIIVLYCSCIIVTVNWFSWICYGDVCHV